MNASLFKDLGFETIEDLEKFLDREDIKRIIGEAKYDHYRELWISAFERKVMKERKRKVKGKTNWLALLATPIAWYAYRRMYGWLVAFFTAFIALSFAEYYFNFDASIAFFGVLLVLVFLSKDQYFDHLVRCARKLDAMDDEDAKECFIKRRAGTSASLAILVTLVLVGIMAYITYLMVEKLMQNPNFAALLEITSQPYY